MFWLSLKPSSVEKTARCYAQFETFLKLKRCARCMLDIRESQEIYCLIMFLLILTMQIKHFGKPIRASKDVYTVIRKVHMTQLSSLTETGTIKVQKCFD